jgi:two-component system chemotaxis response regulator CheY
MNAKILIVDDSSLARRTLRKILESEGYTIEEASDGAQGIERYFISRHDIVFLDIVMEGIYGMEVLNKIRELDQEARVIVATSDIQHSTRDDAKQAGAVALINKPFNRDEILRVVSAVLEGGMAWN